MEALSIVVTGSMIALFGVLLIFILRSLTTELKGIKGFVADNNRSITQIGINQYKFFLVVKRNHKKDCTEIFGNPKDFELFINKLSDEERSKLEKISDINPPGGNND